MRPPPPDRIRAAVTQAEVTAVSVPVLEGAEVDANFKVGEGCFIVLAAPQDVLGVVIALVDNIRLTQQNLTCCHVYSIIDRLCVAASPDLHKSCQLRSCAWPVFFGLGQLMYDGCLVLLVKKLNDVSNTGQCSADPCVGSH